MFRGARVLRQVIVALWLCLVFSGDARAWDPQVQLRSGRLTSLSAMGFSSASVVFLPLGMGLQTYDFRGEWFNKWKYDRSFFIRKDAGLVFNVASIATGAVSIPLLGAGVIVEGRMLQKMTRHSVVPGWIGLGFFSAGVTVGSFGGLSPIFLIAGGTAVAVGWGLWIAQFGMNVHKGHQLVLKNPELYHRRPKVQVGLAPMLGEAKGVALTGVF